MDRFDQDSDQWDHANEYPRHLVDPFSRACTAVAGIFAAGLLLVLIAGVLARSWRIFPGSKLCVSNQSYVTPNGNTPIYTDSDCYDFGIKQSKPHDKQVHNSL